MKRTYLNRHAGFRLRIIRTDEALSSERMGPSEESRGRVRGRFRGRPAPRPPDSDGGGLLG